MAFRGLKSAKKHSTGAPFGELRAASAQNHSKIRSQEKGVLAKGASAESSVTPKETENNQGYWAQQCKPPSKNPLFLAPEKKKHSLEHFPARSPGHSCRWRPGSRCYLLLKVSNGTGLNGTYASHIILRPGTHVVKLPDQLELPGAATDIEPRSQATNGTLRHMKVELLSLKVSRSERVWKESSLNVLTLRLEFWGEAFFTYSWSIFAYS